MKKTLFATAAAVALAAALPAQAAWWHHGDSAYGARGRIAADNAFHYAAATPQDAVLARRIVNDLAADPKITDSTITVAVNRGHVSLSGSGLHGDRAEQIAQNDAGFGRVSGKVMSMGS